MTRDLLQSALTEKFGVTEFATWDESSNDLIFMIKSGKYNNVYRVFAYYDKDEILVQCCGCAYYYDGKEMYDEAIDFNGGHIKLTFSDEVDDWTEMIERIISMHNEWVGAVTVYEYTKEEYQSMVCDTLPDDNAVTIYCTWDDECPYIGVELENGEYWVYGAHNDHQVNDVESIIDALYCK